MSNSKSRTFDGFLNQLALQVMAFGYLPRWAVFLMDVVILILAHLLKHILVVNLYTAYLLTFNVYIGYGLVLAVNVFFFLFFRTYSGIVRHSTFIDGIRLLFATISSFFVLVAVNYISIYFTANNLFLVSGLVIGQMSAFLMLFLFRIFVKYFYDRYTAVRKREGMEKVLIYGTNANAIAVANALKSDPENHFWIVGFLDGNKKDVSKSILGKPIFPLTRRASVIMRYAGAKGIILADNAKLKKKHAEIVEDCLEYNLNVYSVPAITSWEDQQEISKKVKNIQIEDLLERKPIVLDKALISKQLKGKTVMITGAAGSIGSEITRQVLGFKPERLIVIDQAETPLHQLGLEIEAMQSKVDVHAIVADIRYRRGIEKLFEEYKPQVVFHAAAYKHVPLMEENPSQAIMTNVEGTKNLADMACKYQVKKFVMVSTDKAVNPSNVMGASKRIAEKYVQSLQLKQEADDIKPRTRFITTRFGNVLGSNGSVVPLFTKQIAAGGPVTITHAEIIRYFMTIPEACQLVLEAGAMGKGGEIYIFDMGKPVKIIDLARKMIKLAGFVPEKDIKIEIVGLRPGEKLFEELLNDAAKTLPTHHEKIMIAQEAQETFEWVQQSVEKLINSVNDADSHELVGLMKEIVPEFISKNSTFEILDEGKQ